MAQVYEMIRDDGKIEAIPSMFNFLNYEMDGAVSM